MKGTCRNVQADLIDKPDEAPFWVSSHSMMWWSAKHFCETLGKTMVEVSDYECGKTFSVGSENSNCYISGTTTKPEKVQAMCDAYGSTYGWTNTDYVNNSCYAYDVFFGNGHVYYDNRDYNYYAVCK